MDALSAAAWLKREVSDEVDEEFKKEEKLQMVIDNSKEIQYSHTES
jgi:hypothetical protein